MLPKQGLYDPQFEHDNCGMGFIVNLDGAKTHDVIKKGIEILINLTHRGACGCDPETGDGAGILIQIPHEFFARECAEIGFSLPDPGQYGVGMVFLPVEPTQMFECQGIIESLATEEGLTVLGWRDTPTNGNAIGRHARASQPYIQQVFVRAAAGMSEAELERKLFVVSRRAESAVLESDIRDKSFFYIPSMSARTIVYKGLLLAPQISDFYRELRDPETRSSLCMVHQRFSTNTFPAWPLAHPYRYICHNGEINTVRGNVNWMNARQSILKSDVLGDDLVKIFPAVRQGLSDTGSLDRAVEILTMAGRELPHVMAMLMPEAWDADTTMPPEKRAFYEYHAQLMEPWDGPAAVAFTDGKWLGATLDRNGLRPARYLVTKDNQMILASETGVLPVKPENVAYRGRLQPGKMLLVNLEEHRIVPDEEIKAMLSSRQPYGQWLKDEQITLDSLPEPPRVHGFEKETLRMRQRAFGYSEEELKMILQPMAEDGQEPVGSMGTDTPLACLSNRPQSLFNYFKQMFAQVTNPAIDPIREELVMSLTSYIGTERNIFDETPKQAHLLKLPHPILTNYDLEKLRRVSHGDILATTLRAVYPVADGGDGLARSLEGLCKRAVMAVADGYNVVIISDRGIDPSLAPMPSLLALSAVHNYLVREQKRTQVALIIESGEPREVHHFAALIGYGASAINPYLAIETLEDMVQQGRLKVDFPTALKNFKKSINKGLLKVFSKMGISTLQSYRGAQIFEAIGLDDSVIQQYFTGTASRISGVGLEVLAKEAAMKHTHAFEPVTESHTELISGGQYHYRVGGEHHIINPLTVSKLQHAVKDERYETFKEFSALVDQQNAELSTLRGLMVFRENSKPLKIEEVEPASEIVKRFATGAMSFGSISKEAHETIAIAMNRIGGRSNTGEGGEDAARFLPDANGDLRRSSVKQVASGRFGVTAHYLVNADELQIKVAQGAKPGEGGQLPGHKVDEVIARVRYSVPGVGLISPPPHHDIYSIEDLAQLIYDLKNVNSRARISVKLVSEVGVGTVAAGVAKAHADVILIAGYDGGTGASPLTSLKHAGGPWELGLSETQQTLVMNDLRSRVILQTDGKLQTGRDVAIAALLGAEEFGFSTAPLVSLGCIMMRKCHLNTCPVGIATQDPALRKKFAGKPENVINYFFFVAEQLREIMAKLGFRRLNDMVGRSDRLEMRSNIKHWKASGLNFEDLLYHPQVPSSVGRRCTISQDHGLEEALDARLIDHAKPALEDRTPVEFVLPIRNVDRTVGAMLSGEIARKYGAEGLDPGTIHFRFNGSAGQSFGAFLARGVTLELEGDSNDYVGKGLSGGKIIVYPPRESTFKPDQNILVGNVVLYGATSGEAFFNGRAGERFAVRNSGATTVVEGVGDHGCEYMTKGLVICLSDTGKNFAAGMSGGIAYVLDESGEFQKTRCNKASVDLEKVSSSDDIEALRYWIARHAEETSSVRANWILDNFDQLLPKFVKVFPHEYKRVMNMAHKEASSRG